VLGSLCSLFCVSPLQQEKQQLLVILTNLAAESGSICRWIVENHPALLQSVINRVMSGDMLKLPCSQLLSNVSLNEPSKLNSLLDEHWPSALADIFKLLTPAGDEIDGYENHIGNIVLNLSTQRAVRDKIASEHLPDVLSLLSTAIPFTRRYNATCVLYNLSLDDELHSALLNEPYDLLSTIVAPLADRDDELDEDEVAKLPILLQYYDGRREVREFVLLKSVETLYQLCATSHGRKVLRSKGIYAILRELDKATSGHVIADEGNFKDTLHSLIGVLIRDEADMCIPHDLVSIRNLTIGS